MPYLLFDNQPLLYDLNREAADFVERYQSLGDTVLSGMFPHSQSWQTNPNSKTTNIGLPLVNWPKPPPLKINQLYYPVTGASRWAEGIFLCNGQAKAKIESCDIEDTGASLKWATDDPPTLNTLLGTGKRYVSLNRMWPIAFRRIGGCSANVMHDPKGVLSIPAGDPSDAYDLYLVHLVDIRYWWQFIDAGIICEHTKAWKTATPTPAGEPTGLINYLCDRLGLVMLWADADNASWPTIYTTLGPHQSEWSRSHHNAAQLLDAALESVGARLVAQTDAAVVPYGGFEIQRAAGAERRFLNNIANGHWIEQIAGTDCGASYTHILPNAVEVLFPSSRFGMLCGQCNVAKTDLTEEDCHEAYWPIVHEKTEYSGVSNSCAYVGAAKTIFVRGWADMGKCGDTAPMNNTEVVALASQIAYDWFMYHKRQYDFTVVGPTNWDPCGYDDCIIHKFGVEEDEDLKAFAHSEIKQTGEVDTTVILQQERRRDCTSRIQSLPLNVGADCQLHNTNALELPGSLMVRSPQNGMSPFDCKTAQGVLCDAYRLVGNLACGPLTLKPITAINSANKGQKYKVLVYLLCAELCDTSSGVGGNVLMDTLPMECCARKVLHICCECEESSESSQPPSSSSSSSPSSSQPSSSPSSSQPSSSQPSSSHPSSSEPPSSQPPSTSEPSSSRERCPCAGTCLYSGYFTGTGMAWILLVGDSTCASPCSCDPPASPPRYVGETASGSCWGPCESSSSQQSSSVPSSQQSSSVPSSQQSSSVPSSQQSSSVPPSSDSGSIVLCSHECTWTWISGEWVSSTQGCEPECPICSGKPTSPGNYEGEFVIRPCAQ